MSGCRFVSTTEPRVIPGRHADPCTCDDREIGCLPCPEMHCVVCGKEHAKAACTGCLDAARSDLEAIGSLCASLPAEAVEKGVQSEAMMLLGPTSDPEAWRNHATSAMVGRLDASYLEDCRDELHPLWVMGSWEQIWRDFLDHQTIHPVTWDSAYSYLNTQIGYMAEQVDPPFDEFARELRGCRAHLENVLHDGVRVERGAPCVQCEKPMTRGGDDHWHCHTCHRTVTEAEYRFAVGAAYVAHSDRLTATDMAERIGVKASIIRVWGSRGLITKRGRNNDGLTLYDVESATSRRDSMGQVEAG
jgi:ribosomal protein L37AE/L43A